MARHATITGALSFEQLEGQLLRDLSEHTRAPGETAWVLVPTNLLAAHLRRTAGARLGGVVGVQFFTLRVAAQELATVSLALDCLSPMPAEAAHLVIEEALAGPHEKGPFGAFRGFPGSCLVILRAIRLLANSLWTPPALRQAARHLSLTEADAGLKLKGLAALWERLEHFKGERRFYEEEDLLLRAADEHETAGPEVALLYGFYDLTPLQQRLVGRILGPARTAGAYLLWDESVDAPAPGFEYAASTVQWLKGLLGVPRVRCLGRGGGGTDLARLRADLGRQGDAAEGDINHGAAVSNTFDGSVRILNCPNQAGEADEVARQLLRLYGAADSRDAPSVGVLLRTADDVAGTIHESLERARLAHCIHGARPLSQTAAGRTMLGLVRLASGEAERSAVVALLSTIALEWPEGLSPTALDRLSRLAGILKGWNEWDERLGGLGGSLLDEARRCEHEAEAATRRQEAEQCRLAGGLLGEFLQEVRAFSDARSWEAVGRLGCGLVERYTCPDDEGRDQVLGVAGGVRQLDVTPLRPTPERVARLLERLLTQTRLAGDGDARAGVSVCEIMASRGTTHDVVLVPGLVEKAFPRTIRADPILSDWERAALTETAAGLGCGPVPLQNRRPREEDYLFRLALASARKAVVLTFPRLEQASGRPMVFSRFVQEVCETLCGRPVDAHEIEEGTLGGLATRVRPGSPVEPVGAVDQADYDLAVYRQAASREVASAYARSLSDTFGRAAAMEDSRWGGSGFGPYDGRILAPPLRATLEDAHFTRAAPVSPSRLEAYAACPFGYFLRYVLEVQEPVKPEEEHALPPEERGRLVHALLRDVYARALSGRKLGALGEGDVSGAVSHGSRVLDGMGRPHADARPAAWSVEREGILEELERLVTFERAENADAVPVAFELSFGLGGEQEAFELPVSPGWAVRIRGRIDRVDQLGVGAIQVIDYKTGAAGSKPNSLAGGTQLQLPLYLLACARIMQADAGRARYLYLRGPGFRDQFTLQELAANMEELQRVVQLILEGIAEGEFFPLPAAGAARACEAYCPFHNICGHARDALAQAKGGGPDSRRLRELRNAGGA